MDETYDSTGGEAADGHRDDATRPAGWPSPGEPPTTPWYSAGDPTRTTSPDSPPEGAGGGSPYGPAGTTSPTGPPPGWGGGWGTPAPGPQPDTGSYPPPGPYGAATPYDTRAPYGSTSAPGSANPYGSTSPGSGTPYGPAGSYGAYGPPGPPPSPGGWGPGSSPQSPYWPAPAPHRSSRSVAVTAILVVVALGAGILIGSRIHSGSSTTSAGPQPFGSNSTQTLPATAPTTPSTGGGGAGPADASAIAQKVDPGLVDVDTQLGYQNEAAAGTGIVLTSGGLVLTNNHVINGSTLIEVTDLGNKKTYKASVVGYDETMDVAVVQLQGASGLTTATLGNSTTASVGQQVVAIGNAGGTGGTPSVAGGTVTGLGQSITASDEGDGTSEKLQDLIETNANVRPGDSGGSLVDTRGIVIGMDTAASEGFSLSGGGGTAGYAIPINTAVKFAHEIVAQKGSSTVHIGPTAFVGVSFHAATTGGLDNSVFQVISGTAAKRAGLAKGDVITNFGPASIASPGDLTKALVPYHPGDHVVIAWKSPQGQSHKATVTLTAGPNA
jgi:S1-C subfamily serine protease